MGLLDSILGSVLGQGTQAAQPQQSNAMLEAVLGLIHNPQIGGLSGLMTLFQSQGLQHILSGWIGTGPNPGITPTQLTSVLGNDQIAAIATKLGLSPDQAAAQLSQVLPHVVDHMTPDGSIPQGTPDMSSMLNMLKSKLLG